MKDKTATEIFLFVPNLIGYFRLILIGISWCFIDDYMLFLPLYIFSASLDAVDGWTARKLHQTSEYGAVVDVVVDLIGRGMVWCHVSKYGYAVVAFEWLVFVGNTERANGNHWKSSFEKAPTFVHWVMDKGFKTPLGTVAITGLHVLPVWLYGLKMIAFNSDIFRILQAVKVFLIASRIVCASVETWCLWKYIEYLLHKDSKKLG